MTSSGRPFDAILLVAFGGPQRSEEIRPFLEDVLRGRPVPASRIDEVARHYERIGGRSPLVELTALQHAALAAELARRGVALPMRCGMRHSRPYLRDVLHELVAQGARRVLAVIMAAFHDRATVSRYAAAVQAAHAELGFDDLAIEYTAGASEAPGFVAACASHIRDALSRLPAELASDASLVFTAHSVPTPVGEAGYVALYESAARRIAAALGRSQYVLAYQSRSGSPRDPWLEPDVCDVIRAQAAAGCRALVVSPIAFVCDHVEVLYDLDVEAAELASSLGVELRRAKTVTAHPAYIEALADTITAALSN